MAKTFNVKSKNLLESLENGYSEPASPPKSPSSLSEKVEENLLANISYYTPENAPEDYKSLKKEVKVLADVHAKTFIILAHRLKIIRDKELYKEDGYSDFTEFVQNELNIARRTVYNYISVFEEYGVQYVAQDTKIKLLNLFISIPFVKRHPEDKEAIFNSSQSLPWSQFKKFLQENYADIKEENESEEEESIHFYSSEEELINNSKFVRAGMKEKTVKAILKDMTNWLLLHKPKNNKVKKMIDILKDL